MSYPPPPENDLFLLVHFTDPPTIRHERVYLDISILTHMHEYLGLVSNLCTSKMVSPGVSECAWRNQPY